MEVMEMSDMALKTGMKKSKDRLVREFLAEFGVLILGGLMISLLYANNLLLTAWEILLGAFGLSIWRKDEDLAFFAVGAVFGPLGEMICIRFGVWAYANPTALGIPLWLPFAWGFASLLIRRTSGTMTALLSAE